MTRVLTQLKGDPELRKSMVQNGLETIRKRHTCAHRAAELMNIYATLRTPAEAVAA